MSKQHVMLDIETFGKGSFAAIVSIGAVKFDPYGDLGEKFYCRVNLKSSLDVGLRLDAETLAWWLDEERHDARVALLKDPAVDIQNALEGFAAWVTSSGDPVVWGNGATFDNVIVANAYLACGIERPWKVQHDRCFRTLKAMANDAPKPEAVGTGHHALDDAVWQALYLQAIVKHNNFKL